MQAVDLFGSFIHNKKCTQNCLTDVWFNLSLISSCSLGGEIWSQIVTQVVTGDLFEYQTWTAVNFSRFQAKCQLQRLQGASAELVQHQWDHIAKNLTSATFEDLIPLIVTSYWVSNHSFGMPASNQNEKNRILQSRAHRSKQNKTKQKKQIIQLKDWKGNFEKKPNTHKSSR